MKRGLLAVAILALAFPAFRRADGAADVSINFFYDNLTDGGNWIEVGDYGYCWQPSVAVSNRNWRPYSDGYWAYTEVGWTWVSYEDFGWATYHYGRWVRLRDRGWAWVPGRDWGPSWVSWRTGGDYVGWAPLPPRRAGDVFVDFSPINSRVDVEFDIGPAYYNFIDVRYIGEPVLRERILATDQNVTYISKTVNVTNITYSNSQVYNYGPDYNTMSRYSTRPIQRLSLQRETNVAPATAVRSKSFMKVEGDKLVVAAPQKLEKSSAVVAPKVVKEKIAQPTIEKGWEPAGDAKAQAELKEKMKKEDPKSVPPPTVRASEKAGTSPAPSAPPTIGGTTTPRTSSSPAAGANANPPATAAPPAAASPSASPAKNKNKRRDFVTPTPRPVASPAVNPATPPGKKITKNPKAATSVAPSPSVPPVTTPAPTHDKGKNKQPEKAAPKTSVPPATTATATKEKSNKKKEQQPNVPAPAAMQKSAPRVAPPMTPETKHNKPVESTKPKVSAEKPKHVPPTNVAPKVKPVPPATAPVHPPPSHGEGKKPKKNQPATSPTP